MKAACDIIHANVLAEESWDGVAEQLSENSRTEAHILFRSGAYFLEKIRTGHVIIAVSDGDIIGSVCLHTLSPAVCELGSAWVAKHFRGQGIYSLLKDAALKFATELGGDVISMSRVSRISMSHGLKSSLSRGMLPMSFHELALKDPEAYKQCCCCGEGRNHQSCSERDRTCILTAKVSNADDVQRSLTFVSGQQWLETHIPDDEKARITRQVEGWHRNSNEANGCWVPD